MYQYFPHKQALFYALNERYLDVLASKVEAACDAQHGATFQSMIEALVEPGPTGTNFGAGLDHAEPMSVYDNTPAGEVRRGVNDGGFVIKGDAERTVDAMIVAADAENPAMRLTLGSTAYASITAALADRLRTLEGQRSVAFSADRA
jgi:AcrR family transcriptional regulator